MIGGVYGIIKLSSLEVSSAFKDGSRAPNHQTTSSLQVSLTGTDTRLTELQSGIDKRFTERRENTDKRFTELQTSMNKQQACTNLLRVPLSKPNLRNL